MNSQEVCKRCIGKGTRWDGRHGPCTRCNGSGIAPKPEEATSERFREWMERVAPDDERNMEWDDERPLAAPAVGESGRDA